jgi:hypothetical protein
LKIAFIGTLIRPVGIDPDRVWTRWRLELGCDSCRLPFDPLRRHMNLLYLIAQMTTVRDGPDINLSLAG